MIEDHISDDEQVTEEFTPIKDEANPRTMGANWVDVAAPAMSSRRKEGLDPAQEKKFLRRLANKLLSLFPEGKNYDLIHRSLKKRMELAVSSENEQDMVTVARLVWTELTQSKIKVDLSSFLNEAMQENDPEAVKAALEDILTVQIGQLRKQEVETPKEVSV